MNRQTEIRKSLIALIKVAGRTIKDLDLSEYMKGYELNDPAHGPQHAENVRRGAARISGIHAPGKEHLVDYAAAMHDMEVHGGREGHEDRAADVVANSPYFQENLSKRDLRTVAEAVRQHRSSTGRPRTAVAKIVSDADRLAEIDPAAALQRAVSYGQQHEPDLTEDEQILRAYAHLVEKYGPGGKARRLYYPESLPQLEEKINPIISTGGDIEKLKALLREKQGVDDDVYVQSAVPAASRDLVKKHGLLSSQALVNNPEALEAFLADRAGTDWEEDEETFKKRVEEELKDAFWGTSMKGPSVFFGDPDPEKITDVHPIRKLKAETLRINLSKLLRDHPKTRIAGTELVPWDPEGPEAQGHLQHYDIDLDKVREYVATDPKELWKHYDDPEGTNYASDVPHAQIITPSGGIPLEYLDFGEKKAEDEESWYISTSDKDGKGLFAEKDLEAGEIIFHAGELDTNKHGLDDWEMTEAAMACNHSREPNTLVVRDGEELSAVAKGPIKEDDEILVSYFQVTHVIGPGSRLTHNNKPIPPTPAEEMAKWAWDERMDWAGLVHGNAGN